jgi:hypothetical protein
MSSRTMTVTRRRPCQCVVRRYPNRRCSGLKPKLRVGLLRPHAWKFQHLRERGQARVQARRQIVHRSVHMIGSGCLRRNIVFERAPPGRAGPAVARAPRLVRHAVRRVQRRAGRLRPGTVTCSSRKACGSSHSSTIGQRGSSGHTTTLAHGGGHSSLRFSSGAVKRSSQMMHMVPPGQGQCPLVGLALRTSCKGACLCALCTPAAGRGSVQPVQCR